jgi:threonine/homoserine/homoserine lactone efflux protein
VISVTQSLALSGVLLLGAMSPGPDFVLVTRSAALSGRRAGMACALGIAAGVLVWASTTALGIAGLLATSAVAFTVVKLAGAAYLVVLGVRSLLAARGGGHEAAPVAVPRIGSALAFRHGLLTNLLNPKVAVFFIALLPQFLPASPTLFDTAMVGALGAVISLLWFVVVATAVGAMRNLFSRKRFRRIVDAVTGGLLIGLGIRVAVHSG